MNQYLVDSPYTPFTIKNQFKAISNGKVYIGEVDKDPLNPSQQIQVYVVDETGSNVPVSQPIQLNAGGYLVYNGQVSKFITLEPYSIVVLNSVNAEMWRVDDISKVDPDNITASNVRDTTNGGSVQDFIDKVEGGDLTVIATGTTTPRSLGERFADVVNVKDFGAKGDGESNDTEAIKAAINSDLGAVYFPKGTYLVESIITPISGMTLIADNNAEIVSTITTVPGEYNQIFRADDATSNITINGVKFSSENINFNAFGFYGQVTNLTLINNECEGCGLVTTFAGVINANVNNNYIHSPASEGSGVLQPYARAVQLNCLYTGTGSKNINVFDNTILGSWTHGIEIAGNDVQDQLDPLQPKNINNVKISRNTVISLAQVNTAGAIWFSQACDVIVEGNYCQLYGDVGIDCEASTNVLVIGNILRDNNKNLAMYGNNNMVRFTDNNCINTISNLDLFYAKPANENTGTGAGQYWVDGRNTNITIDNNKFYYTGISTGFERIVMGSGGEIIFRNNKLVNTTISANYMSLTEIILHDNEITINSASDAINIGQSYAAGDTNIDPFKASVKRNTVTASGGGICILYTDGDTIGASVDFDKRVDISDNVLRGNTSQYGILLNIAAAITPIKNLYATVASNEVWGTIDVLKTGNRKVTKNISNNRGFTSIPYSQTLNSSGVVSTFGNTFLSTASGSISVSLADGDYSGQIKNVSMSINAGNATMIIAKHRTGINKNAIFSGVGQYACLQWNIDAWDTISTTVAGI